MHTVTVEHAQAHFAELLEEAFQGGRVVIQMRENKAVTLALAVRPELEAKGWPLMGRYEGQGWMAADFNDIPQGFEDYSK